MTWETDPIWLSAAEGIVGEEIHIRWRRPPSTTAEAQAYLHAGGQRVIEITPGLSDKQKLHSLVHEACHFLLGHCQTKTTWAHYPSGSYTKPRLSRQVIGYLNKRETDTERMTQKILDYADQHANKYSGTWLAKRLQALKFYRWQSLIDKAAHGAVDKILKAQGLR